MAMVARGWFLAVLGASCCSISGAAPTALEEPTGGLEFVGRPVKQQYELGEPVEMLLTLRNVSERSISLDLWAAMGCDCDFKMPGISGQAGSGHPPAGVELPSRDYERIAPGGSLQVTVVHDGLTTHGLGDVEVRPNFYGYARRSPPADLCTETLRAPPFTIEVVETELMGAMRARGPESPSVRRALADLLERRARDTEHHMADFHEAMFTTLGAVGIPHLMALAQDADFSPEARGEAAHYLGMAVWGLPREEQPKYRGQTLPPIQGMLLHASPYVRRKALSGLGYVDRNSPHLEHFDKLVLDRDEEVRVGVAYYLWGFAHDPEAWPAIKRVLQDESPRVRRVMTGAHALRAPRKREQVDFIIEACQPTPEDTTLRLLKCLERSVSAREVPALIGLFDTKPPKVRVELIRLAAKTTAPELRDLLARGLADESPEVQAAALDGIEGASDPSLASLLDSAAADPQSPHHARARALLDAVEARPEFPDIREMMADTLPAREGPAPDLGSYGLRAALRKNADLTLRRPLQLYCEVTGPRGESVLCVPVRDERQSGHYHLLVYRNGRQIRRVDAPPAHDIWHLGRYMSIPYGGVGRVWGSPMAAELGLPPGSYELAVEARFLCTKRVESRDDVFAAGPHHTLAQVLTLRSDRIPLEVTAAPAPLSAESLDALAFRLAAYTRGERELILRRTDDTEERITLKYPETAVVHLRGEGSRALDAVLKHFRPDRATGPQLMYLSGEAGPRARQAVTEAYLAGGDKTPEDFDYLSSAPHALPTEYLLAKAFAEIGEEGWSWVRSREALQALDGRLTAEHARYVPAMIEELAARLIARRDRYSARGGESIWGAFRTALFLGRIGDPRAMPVLRRAAASENLLLRWYGAAALKLIDVQTRPPRERESLVRQWLRHCFSNSEEHFMARGRVIPYLSDLLGDGRPEFYTELLRELDDPWMRHDAQVLAQP